MNIRDYVVKMGHLHPDREVLVFQEHRFTGRQVRDRIFRLSNALLGLGLEKGDRVAVLLTNSHYSVECFYALACAGLVLVPMNSRNAAREHLYMLENAEVRAVLVGQEFLGVIQPILSEASGVSHAVCINGPAPQGWLDYETLIAGAGVEEPQIELLDEDLSSIRYTSGTTGRPKGVMHSQRGALTTVYSTLMDGLDIKSTDSVALIGPVTHASGSYILPHLVRGAKVVILPGFDVTNVLRTVEQERVTMIHLIPTMLVMILASPEIDRYDLSSLKTIRYGASPISPDVLKRAIGIFGDIFVQGYGLTEASMPMSLLLKDDHILDGSEKSIRRLSSIGREVTFSKVRIMDDEGNFVPPGQIGEIVVQSSQVMQGYWKNPEATAEALRGGWLHTRDMGFMDEEGYIYLVDRKEDMIISGGFNIYPKEVEDVLYMHPAVLEAAVFGIPDEKWGETVKAAVSLKTGQKATEQEIIEHCKTHLAGYKKPTSVDFLDQLPKGHTGKIVRRELKDPYWRGKERKIN